ncbi:MAG: DUF2384 domain-containing protein [Cyclobacteriaceae bacterium]
MDIVNEPAVRYRKSNEGITKSDFLVVVAETGLSLSEFSKLLPVSKRTVEKVKDEELLSPVVSDRVLQIASLYTNGKELFGNSQSFKDWLQSPVMALGGKKPIEYLNTDTGISIVNDIMGRIEYGVYS